MAAALLSVSAALQVAPGSPCASACLDRSDGDARDPNASSTTVADIVCDDQDFTSTVKGLKFKECTECLQSSRHVNGSEADLYWYLCKDAGLLSLAHYLVPEHARDRA